MAFTFLKAQGYEIGKSLVEEDLIPEALKIMELAKQKGVKLYLPVDIVAAEAFDAEAIAKLFQFKRYQNLGWGLILDLQLLFI